ncbi:hypothetical protein M758_8G112800 [Ceratodon purpureus]|nr:hypothetical protein M758_8G112800 [Ceratodon purpureus]
MNTINTSTRSQKFHFGQNAQSLSTCILYTLFGVAYQEAIIGKNPTINTQTAGYSSLVTYTSSTSLCRSSRVTNFTSHGNMGVRKSTDQKILNTSVCSMFECKTRTSL